MDSGGNSSNGDLVSGVRHRDRNLVSGVVGMITLSREEIDFSRLSQRTISMLSAEIILTTETYSADLEVERRLQIVTAECAFGMNIVRDLFASITDVFGGRSSATQNVLRDAKDTCLVELKREALAIGADAVIAVNLDYNEFSGKQKSMLFLVASGTAVKLKDKSGTSRVEELIAEYADQIRAEMSGDRSVLSQAAANMIEETAEGTFKVMDREFKNRESAVAYIDLLNRKG